ncbi:MAG: HAMP domain-containing histidine kinase [Campylobacterales bacterium]|nr:HAMP domain-containing histidine kinase [Campylobacterales bacterium]
MKREVWIGTLLYALSLVFLFTLLLHFLNRNGFTLQTYLVGSSLLILIGASLGFVFTSFVVSKKQTIDENLLHLTKEILHELNIPLATIKANSEMIKKTLQENEKALKRLQRIEDASVRLERLYTELVYSIKKEIHHIEKESFFVDQVVKERVEVLEGLNRNPFKLDLESLTIYVDKIGFEKMLDNILTNAMKYSDKNAPIAIELKDHMLTIEDHGIGMDEAELVTIFERYYQSDNTRYGEGIGLAIVKAYCDSEKIKIAISSQKGVGTRVSLDLLKVFCY